MKLQSLEDLAKLLPEAEQRKRATIPPSPREQHDGKGKSIHIFLDTKNRKGKSVTIVSGLHHNPQTMEEIATLLKQHCGAGGTVKEGNIEIQGDQRKRVTEKLKSLNYSVK